MRCWQLDGCRPQSSENTSKVGEWLTVLVLEHVLVQPTIAIVHLAFREPGTGPLPAPLSQLPTQFRVGVQAQDPFGQGGIIPRWRQQAGLPLLDDFPDSAHV